ncbi:MAG TPA: peptide-methionine (S)-S-oxide reductase MsrA [Anaerolineae bacterium]|nr:peptide-methionine (S)-S-oxide reductase MsrA [Anaerolineae bacterium]
MTQSTGKFEVATLGGGCFWCVEAVYNDLIGVHSAISGYAGGHVDNPTYKAICTGTTGHAEVVQVTYDPNQVTYQEILEIFFTVHDPTQLNRQGNDVGTQYRSVIFYHDDAQKKMAQAVIDDLTQQNLWSQPIVTEITPLTKFYPAEDYHQEYFSNNPNQPYCQFVVAPKLSKFRSKYTHRLKSQQ